MGDVWQIRRARPEDSGPLRSLWERSVRATHDFLTEDDIAGLRPQVAEALGADALELWVLADAEDAPVGFMGLVGDDIAALFLEPAHHGQGGGRRHRLLRGARLRRHGPFAARPCRPAVSDAPHAPAGSLLTPLTCAGGRAGFLARGRRRYVARRKPSFRGYPTFCHRMFTAKLFRRPWPLLWSRRNQEINRIALGHIVST